MAQKKMLAPNVAIWWVPKSGVTDYQVIKATEIASGSNISCAIVEGYTLNSTDPNTDNTRTICDEGNVDNPTSEQYEGSLTFFRDKDLSDIGANTSVFNKAFSLFMQPGADGYLVRRIGFKSDIPIAATQEVEVFGFTSDYPQSVDGAEGGPPIQFTVKFLPTGETSGLILAA